jgi:hypothetical protein
MDAFAAADYRLLLDRKYPVKATLKLVGDRYRLNKVERNILFRGILDSETSKLIASRIITVLPDKAALAVDGHNVLFTLINYRKGRRLFIGTDGLLRDAGGAHGRLPAGTDFSEVLSLFCSTLVNLDLSKAVIYLDAPVSGSGLLAARLRSTFSGLAEAPSVIVETVPSADPFVRNFRGNAVASSDSAVARSSAAPVFDLARMILTDSYGVEFMEMARFFPLDSSR